MRPVLLEMNGFACFREPTSVDFTDADYFALVGPTGSGKSTVVDALTFALYGSVPRWGRKGMVSLALAPTTTRGTVRLLFDVASDRYVVAREVRRTTTTVNMKSARLERLGDPAGTGSADEVTEVLASDSEVTGAVERLLGLSFENFCQCVVLPQGEFAEFLRSSQRDRQEILLKLLGAEHYEAIARQANARASRAHQRATLLGEQLAGLVDATAEAEQAAREQEASLGQLVTRVEMTLPMLAEKEAVLGTAQREHEQLRSEVDLLSALNVPAGVAELDRDLTAAKEALTAARSAESVAQNADTAARERLAAAPDRGPLEQARRHHAEHVKLTAALPEAQVAQINAATALERAKRAVSAAAATLEEARAARDAASRRAADARATVDRLTNEQRLLGAVAVPNGLAELDERARDADVAATATRTALEEAERGDMAARNALEHAPDRAPLEQALHNLAELADVQARLPDLTMAHETAVAERLAAEQEVALAVQRAEAARHARDAAMRADMAAALRPHLVAGAPCPVCTQTVTSLPAALEAPALTTADEAIKESDNALASARTAEGETGRDEAAAAVALESATTRIGQLRAALNDRPQDPAEIIATLRCLDELAEAARSASRALQAARGRGKEAQAELDRVSGDLTTARAELRAARDPLVTLGCPTVDDTDLRAGWTALAMWAREQAHSRSAQLTAAQSAETETAEAVTAKTKAFSLTELDVARLRDDETAAVKTSEKAGANMTTLQARLAELADLLRDTPSDADAQAQLASVDRLEAAAREADKKLRSARGSRERAQQVEEDLSGRATTAWTALRSARDPLVTLGAPEPTTTTLLAAWTMLLDWAAEQTGARNAALPGVLEQVATATMAYEEVSKSLTEDLAHHAVVLPPGELAATVLAAVAAAHALAHAATDRIVERRGQAEQLTAQRKDAETEQQVAKMLGDLLRSDKFPRWLAAAALDTLVIDASKSLAELSGGQFELTHDRGEFFVIDHADADSRRSVRTLSGGETFQASLALALALSAQMSTLTAASVARLDSIFLDEGFGTLDQDALEVVASTLENLAQGERVVGIITHVTALAERVPVRFLVHRNVNTSTVVRESP